MNTNQQVSRFQVFSEFTSVQTEFIFHLSYFEKSPFLELDTHCIFYTYLGRFGNSHKAMLIYIVLLSSDYGGCGAPEVSRNVLRYLGTSVSLCTF